MFLKVIENKELKKLKETIDSHFNLREDLYFPHISLFYGDIKREKKIEIINDLEAPRKIILDKLSIVRVDEDLQSWQIIKSYCLRHPQ